MNQRIQELADEAWVYQVQVFNEPDGSRTYTQKEKVFDKEKFADLIVAECCSKLEEMGKGWQEFAKNPPDGQAHNASGALFAAYRLKEDAVDAIKEHFGVEQ